MNVKKCEKHGGKREEENKLVENRKKERKKKGLKNKFIWEREKTR